MTDNAGSELVIYIPSKPDISRKIQRIKTPIHEINPESRMAVDNGMFAGGFEDLKFDRYGIDGVAYVKYFNVVKMNANPSALSLSEKMSRKIFGEQKCDAEHEGIKYKELWKIKSSAFAKQIIRLNPYSGKCEPIPEVLADLKTEFIEREFLVPNKLLTELFHPLYEPLIDTYMSMMRF